VKKHIYLAVALAVLGGVSAGAATPSEMSVQVKNVQLRSTPSFLGKPVAGLGYGDRVGVLEKQDVWLKVTAPGGESGWIHQSALTPRKIVLKAGADEVGTTASSEELALAGKGFNSDVEAEFKSQNKDIDFTWIDKMEKIAVSPDEMTRFLKEGGVAP
jgi:SH3-like domain-containing protein